MNNETLTENLAYEMGITMPTTRKVMTLVQQLTAGLPDDHEGQQRAFYNAVRAAWVQGEKWAQEWVESVVLEAMSNE
ncbi:hypothetical protein ACF1GW_38630 [Streptomyces achromogenes]|uniref:hypothetical protein n=1 Tax=Streptomyces achromogenes TaxID=67255 RepID=UPI0036FD6802